MKEYLENYFNTMLPLKNILGEDEFVKQTAALISTMMCVSEREIKIIVRTRKTTNEIIESITKLVRMDAA